MSNVSTSVDHCQTHGTVPTVSPGMASQMTRATKKHAKSNSEMVAFVRMYVIIGVVVCIFCSQLLNNFLIMCIVKRLFILIKRASLLLVRDLLVVSFLSLRNLLRLWRSQ